jgi:TRAP-type mannitol/chloroaromatic compound transport system substrate-binding protein
MRGSGKWTSVLAAAALVAVPVAGTHAQDVEGPEVSWKLSTWGKERAFTAGVEKVAELVDERTNGNFTIDVVYGEALSKARENLDGIRIGAFEMAMFCNFYHPGKNPAWMVMTMPFLQLGNFQVSKDVRQAVLDHPALEADMDRWNARAYISALLPPYEFLGQGDAPTELGDWDGMRVRAGGGIGLAMEKLGATRTTVPATEVYTSIDRGTVDAASFPYTYAHAAYQIHQVSDWFTSNMSPGTTECATVIGKDAYNDLPEQYQQLLQDVKDEAYAAQIQAYQDIDKKNEPMFREELTEVTYTQAQLEKFKEVAGEPVWNEWVADNEDQFDAQGLLDFVRDEIEKAREKHVN